MTPDQTFKILSIERNCNSCKYADDRGMSRSARGMKCCSLTDTSSSGIVKGYFANCRENNFRDWELE